MRTFTPTRFLALLLSLALAATFFSTFAAAQEEAPAVAESEDEKERADPMYDITAFADVPIPGLDDVPEQYRLSDRDKEFLPMIRPIEPIPGLSKAKLDALKLADPDFAILVGRDGWKFTVAQLNAFLWADGHQRPADDMYKYTPDLILRAIERGAFAELVQSEALEKGYGDNPGVISDMRFVRQQVYNPIITEYAFATRGEPVSDQMVELAYERDRNTKYRQAMGFEAYQIFLMAYERYTVEPGDTLLAIARKVTGSESAVTEIRSDDKRRVRRYVPDSQRERLAYSPIVPGEKLLVPMDQAGMERIASIAREIEDKLAAGEDFEALAREYSDDDRPGELVVSSELRGEARMLPELLQAIKDAEPGTTTPFLRTKHGFQILKVISKTPERFLPLDDAAPRIRSEMQRNAVFLARQSFLDDLRSSPTAQIRGDLIQKTAKQDLLSADEVIATVDGKDITFEDAFGSDAMRIRWSEASGPEDRVRLIKENRVFNDILYQRFAADHGWDKSPVVDYRLGYYKKFSLAKRIGADEQLGEYYESTPLLYRFYVENPALMGERARYKFRLLEKRVPGDEEEAAAIAARLHEIKEASPAPDEFEKIVKAETDEPVYRESGGLFDGVYYNEMSDGFRFALYNAEPGTWIGPFESDGRFNLVYLIEREDNVVPPFEAERVSRRAAALYEKRVMENLLKDYTARKVQEYGVAVNPELLD